MSNIGRITAQTIRGLNLPKGRFNLLGLPALGWRFQQGEVAASYTGWMRLSVIFKGSRLKII